LRGVLAAERASRPVRTQSPTAVGEGIAQGVPAT
jgi:hypothetical protein